MPDPEVSAFNLALAKVFEYEGGLVDDPDDPGALTKFGISKRVHDEVDIEALTKESAAEIYREEYWEAINLDELAEQYPFVAVELFEQAVNLGPPTAILNAQKAVNYLGKNIEVDGVMGPYTLGALKAVAYNDGESLLKVLNALQFKRYLEIVDHNPTLKKYARGWLRRVQV